MKVQHFFDKRTSTLTYVVYDGASKTGVVIDPVLDFEQPAGRFFEESLDTLCAFIDEQGLTIPYVLDTHVHADHMTGMRHIKDRYGSETAIGAGNPVKFWAYAFFPRDLDTSAKAPLLVFPHGGVHADFTTYYIHIVRELLARQCNVSAWDPVAIDSARRELGDEPVRLDTDVAGAFASIYPRLACVGTTVYAVWRDDRDGHGGYRRGSRRRRRRGPPASACR